MQTELLLVFGGLRDLLPCTVSPHAHAFIHHTTILEFSQSILVINPTIPSIYTSIDHELFLPYMSLIFLPINQLPVSNHHSRVIIPSSYYKTNVEPKIKAIIINQPITHPTKIWEIGNHPSVNNQPANYAPFQEWEITNHQYYKL